MGSVEININLVSNHDSKVTNSNNDLLSNHSFEESASVSAGK